MHTKDAIEIIAVCTIPLSIVSVIAQSVMNRLVLGVRALQFLALAILSALILVLTLENILEKSAAGAILGTLAGYFFSQINEFDKRADWRKGVDGGAATRGAASQVNSSPPTS